MRWISVGLPVCQLLCRRLAFLCIPRSIIFPSPSHIYSSQHCWRITPNVQVSVQLFIVLYSSLLHYKYLWPFWFYGFSYHRTRIYLAAVGWSSLTLSSDHSAVFDYYAFIYITTSATQWFIFNIWQIIEDHPNAANHFLCTI